MLCRQLPRTHIPELFQRQHLARHDDSLILDGELHHPHGHLHQLVQRIRRRREMLRRAEMLSVIGDHLIQQGIPDRFLALIMLIDAGLHEPERCTQFADVCACIAVLRKHFQRSVKDPLFRVVRHHNLPGQQVTFRSPIIVNERSLVKLFLFAFPVRGSLFQE